LYGAQWAAAAEVLSILSLYGAVATLCVLSANVLTSLGRARLTLVVQLGWLGALIPAMALGVRRDGIVGAAAAHVVVIGLIVGPSYLVALKRAAGVQIGKLSRAILPSLLAASLSALGALGVARQFARPLEELVFGLAAGVLIYFVAAAGEILGWLSPDRIARLRTSRVFRCYMAVGRIVTVAANLGPLGLPTGGRYDARHASPGRDRHAAARRVLPSDVEARVPRHAWRPE